MSARCLLTRLGLTAAALLLASTGATTTAGAATSEGLSAAEATPLDVAIGDCLTNPGIAPEEVVLRINTDRPNVPPQWILECGDPNIDGLRHIDAGHPIGPSALEFQACLIAILSEGQPFDASPTSTGWSWGWSGGVATAYTRNDEPVVLSANTGGNPGNNWAGCAADVYPPAQAEEHTSAHQQAMATALP